MRSVIVTPKQVKLAQKLVDVAADYSDIDTTFAASTSDYTVIVQRTREGIGITFEQRKEV